MILRTVDEVVKLWETQLITESEAREMLGLEKKP